MKQRFSTVDDKPGQKTKLGALSIIRKGKESFFPKILNKIAVQKNTEPYFHLTFLIESLTNGTFVLSGQIFAKIFKTCLVLFGYSSFKSNSMLKNKTKQQQQQHTNLIKLV